MTLQMKSKDHLAQVYNEYVIEFVCLSQCAFEFQIMGTSQVFQLSDSIPKYLTITQNQTKHLRYNN